MLASGAGGGSPDMVFARAIELSCPYRTADDGLPPRRSRAWEAIFGSESNGTLWAQWLDRN